MEIPVPEGDQERPCLSEEQIKGLADYSLRLERHYGHPQDTEWALDKHGRIIILQTRPLILQSQNEGGAGRTTPVLPGYPLLFEGGAVASPGVGFGPAFVVNTDDDLMAFPDGAVLVSKHSSPKFVVAMPKAQAILTDSGSVSGHMASLTREFSVPTIVGTKDLTSNLANGLGDHGGCLFRESVRGQGARVAEAAGSEANRDQQRHPGLPDPQAYRRTLHPPSAP